MDSRRILNDAGSYRCDGCDRLVKRVIWDDGEKTQFCPSCRDKTDRAVYGPKTFSNLR